MSVIFNFYGGPGAGKSTTAAYVYSRLKAMGYNAELVREYVKKWAWDKRAYGPFDQVYFLGKQTYEETKLYGKADYIITDCPIALGAVYARQYSPPAIAEISYDSAVKIYKLAESMGHQYIHIIVHRQGRYNRDGRYEDEAMATVIDNGIIKLLNDMAVPFVSCSPNFTRVEELMQDILRQYADQNH